MKKSLLTLTALSCMGLSASRVLSGGFQLNEGSARSMGMAFASAAGSDDASTIFYNPAGLTSLSEGFHATLGGALIMPRAKFTGIVSQGQFTTTDMNAWNFPIPHAYFAYSMPKQNLAFGLGVFVPFGLGTEWDPNWIGRNLAVKTYLETIAINPNVAISLLDKKLSLAAGVVFALGKVELQQRVTSFSTPTGEPLLDLKGDGNQIGWNVGATYQATDNLKIGVAYRHNLKMEYNGDAVFTVDPSIRQLFQDGPGGTTINLPFDLRSGISYKFSDKFMAEIGIDVVGWSSYDTLAINFDKLPGNPGVAGVVKNGRNYKDALTYRIGGEYTASDNVKVRAGFYYDSVPVDAKYTQPFLPDANRLGFTLGLGYRINNKLSVDVAYLGIYGQQREVKESPVGFNGIYNSYANVVSIGLNFSL